MAGRLVATNKLTEIKLWSKWW